MIDEKKILDFINKNDKRRGAKLEEYRELIERLLSHKISKKKIYEFIKQEDETIGTQINFYKFIKRNIEINQSQKKATPKNEKGSTPKSIEPKKETREIPTTPVKISKISVLQQDFDLMNYDN